MVSLLMSTECVCNVTPPVLTIHPEARATERMIYTIYTVCLLESQSCEESGMGILPMNHRRDARATASAHAIGL